MLTHHCGVLSFSRGAPFGTASNAFKMLDALLICSIKIEMHGSKLLGSNIATFVVTLPVGLITSEVELNDIEPLIHQGVLK